MAGFNDEIDYQKILDNHVTQLLELFDSVRIFVTRTARDDDGTGTEVNCRGGGNFYASLGYVREWLLVQDHRVRLQIEREDAEADE